MFGLASANVKAQGQFKISVSSPAEIKIEGQLLSPAESWSFRNVYAGVLGLAERVEDFRATRDDGDDAGARKIAPGEFRSSVAARTIGYVVRLPGPTAADVSHVSWIAGDSGFLMLADLLPENFDEISVELSLPAAWISHSAIEADAQGRYHVVAAEKAVFFIGRSLRKQSKQIDKMSLECVVDGAWPFKDTVAMDAASRLLAKYSSLTGFRLPHKSVVMIAPLPVVVGSVKWRAETRGPTVVLLIDPHAPFRNWPGQLGVIFTHEMLHLWVPNSLHFQGDYDWFFEGFTLYTALVTALELKLINFKEYLATLGRVYDSYLAQPDDLSLIEASERRWTSGNTVVYDKGMLVAFLFDLTMSRESGGKTRLAGRYRELFRRAATAAGDGNEVIIQLLSSTPATAELAKQYVEGRKELNLKPIFTDQKQLSKSLGYH